MLQSMMVSLEPPLNLSYSSPLRHPAVLIQTSANEQALAAYVRAAPPEVRRRLERSGTTDSGPVGKDTVSLPRALDFDNGATGANGPAWWGHNIYLTEGKGLGSDTICVGDVLSFGCVQQQSKKKRGADEVEEVL